MQMVFGWFEGSLNRGGVLALCVFRPEVIRKPLVDDWNESAVGKERLSGGQQQSVAYSTWLKFYTPLSHSWQGEVAL